MRITDNRYTGELQKFDLAMRMIRHEARTGTIRACTGFTEDRVRKLVASYCERTGEAAVRRRRGKSPRRIDRFVGNSWRQAEATVLAALFVYCGVASLADGDCQRARLASPVDLGRFRAEAESDIRDQLAQAIKRIDNTMAQAAEPSHEPKSR